MPIARYEHAVLDAMPSPCARALDVGCGTGAFACALAARADQVDAIDRDADVIDRARARPHPPHVRFLRGDVMTHPLDLGGYDLVCAIASLHHLPLRPGLTRLRALVRPGGVLAVIGLFRDDGARDLAVSAVALPISRALRWSRRGAPPDPVPLRDPIETMREIRAAAAELVPGATIVRRLLWRYTLVWRAPLTAAAAR